MKKVMNNDKLLQSTIKNFSNIAQSTNYPSKLAGRFSYDSGVEKKIWDDIDYKLDLNNIDNFLDIGCGCGGLTEFSIDSAENNNYSLSLLDFPEVIKKLKELYINKLTNDINLVEGFFPYDVPKSILSKKFDRILVYSVIHYTDDPLYFIEKTINLLKDRGIVLFADIPNNNSKGRFIASDYGRKFEAQYKKVEISKIPKYTSHHAFVKENSQNNSKINDQLIIDIITKYRNRGYNAFIINQPSTLPFCYTREDLIIQKL